MRHGNFAVGAGGWNPALWMLVLAGIAGPSAEARAANLDMVSTWSIPTSTPGYPMTIPIVVRVACHWESGVDDNCRANTTSLYYGDSTSTTGLTLLGTVRVPFMSTHFWDTVSVYSTTITVPMPGNVLYGTRYIHYYVDSGNEVAEEHEDDNRGYRDIQITGLPDLAVRTLSIAPTSAYPGGSLTATYRVQNMGFSRTATAAALRFYYCPDGSLTTGCTYTGTEVTVPATNAGSYYPSSGDGTVTVTVPGSAVPGSTRYIGAIVDYNNVITEALEDNNGRNTPLTVLTPHPDLVMSAWTTPATAAGSGSSVAINYSVRNQGYASAGAFAVTFYYHDFDSYLPGPMTSLGVVNIPSLAAGSTSSGTSTVTLPATVLNGTRYLHYFIDSADAVAESDESNNRGYRAIDITGQPDLQVTVLSVAPAAQSPGSPLAVTYRVQNAGLTRTPRSSVLRFYYSNDDVITTGGDTYLGVEVTVPMGLVAGGFHPAGGNGTASVVVPAGAVAGTRYIGAIADYANVVAESNETNNTRAAGFTVMPGSGTACTSGAECLSRFCVDGVCCNNACGGGVTTDCMACSRAFGAAVDGTCGPRTAGLPCGVSTSTVCDNPDTCDSSGVCRSNYEPATTVCRPAAGECDIAENCDGAGACPADVHRPAGTACGDPTDTVCDNPDTCSAGGVCQANHESTSVICRADAGECDVPERCDGAGACPADAFEPAGRSCGDPTDTACDNPDACDGSGVCRSNYEPATTVCRPAAGECDIAENCDGVGRCPDDAFQMAGTACGDAASTECDMADSCDGAGVCSDNLRSTDTVCRAAASECDSAERCDGAGNCPADALMPAGSPCGDTTESVCDHADSCDAAGACLDNLAGTDVECRASTGVCDPAENCDGAGACPADVFLADGTSCDDGALCTVTTCASGVCTVDSTIEGCCERNEDCLLPFELCASNRCREVLCRACTGDRECGAEGNRCIDLPSGSFCVVPCDPAVADSCPEGYACGDSGGDDLCLPAAGDCVCRPRAYEACEGGDLIWFDSCGEAGEVSEDCGGRGCAAGACCEAGTHQEGDICVEDSAEGADGGGDVDGGSDGDDVEDDVDGGGEVGGVGGDGSGCGCRATSGGASIPGLLVLLAFGLALAGASRRRRP